MTSVRKTMELIKELVSIPSPTGNTYEVINYIESLLKEWKVETVRNHKGGLIATLPGRDTSRHRMLTAHVDTLGAMVKEIKADGRLKIDLIGGFATTRLRGSIAKLKPPQEKRTQAQS